MVTSRIEQARMGSKKKKTEKQKDFVKTKLKVGKTKAKPDNYTDTSFVAKSISLPNQSLNQRTKSSSTPTTLQGPSEDIDLSHHLSLTKHHSSNTRKEVLGYIESHLPTNPSAYKAIITSITPLITDESLNVRQAVILLLNACVTRQPGLLALHIRPITLFIHAAMSHIQSDIRNTSTKFLQVIINHASQALIRSYFIKTLKNYFTLMAWTLKQDKKSVSLAITTSSSIGGSTKKARIHHLQILKSFLEKSLWEENDQTSLINWDNIVSIHPQTNKYLLPDTPQTYSSLKLFIQEIPKPITNDEMGNDEGKFTLGDLDLITTEDLDTRRKVLIDVFMEPMVKNLNNLVKEGGEVGREAHSCLNLFDKLNEELKPK